MGMAGPLALGVGMGITGGGPGLQGSSERGDSGEDGRDKNRTARGKKEGGENDRGREAARLQRHQDTGAVCSQLCGDECDRHANSGQHPCTPQTQAPSPATAPRATKLEPEQEVSGWVCTQTQHGPHCPA